MPLRILIADDNVDSAEAIGMLLEMSGYHIDIAENGKQALAHAQAQRPDVVVLDIGMPDINGYEIARQIRASDWGKHMTLIACTGWGQAEDKRSAAEAGFDAHLTKPFEPSALENLIAETHRAA